MGMPKGGGLSQSTIERINAEVAAERAEREAREALLPPKVGRDPNRPYHPLWNPSREVEQSFLDSPARDRERRRTKSQEMYWRKAVELIKAGSIASYADLGSRFKLNDYDRQKTKRETYTAEWAYLLVSKMVVRGVLTKDEVQRLIADTTSPFKRKKQSTQ